MNLKEFILLQRFIELELPIILILGIATHVVTPGYKGFRDFYHGKYHAAR